jgi:hypothetical protein
MRDRRRVKGHRGEEMSTLCRKKIQKYYYIIIQ